MRRVLSHPFYTLLAFSGAFAAFILILAAHNIAMLRAVASLPSISPGEFLSFFLTFLASMVATLPLHETVLIGLSALLIGINIALAVFYVRHNRAAPPAAGSVGILGTVSAFLGLGCAACGSLLLASLLGGSLGGILVFLPLGGKEASLFGIALLAFAMYKLTRGINKPHVCPM